MRCHATLRGIRAAHGNRAERREFGGIPSFRQPVPCPAFGASTSHLLLSAASSQSLQHWHNAVSVQAQCSALLMWEAGKHRQADGSAAHPGQHAPAQQQAHLLQRQHMHAGHIARRLTLRRSVVAPAGRRKGGHNIRGVHCRYSKLWEVWQKKAHAWPHCGKLMTGGTDCSMLAAYMCPVWAMSQID